MDVELHDWEVVDDSTSIANSRNYLDGIESDSEGIIRSDYFSLDSHTTYVVEDHVSVESENPSWIDPVSDTCYSRTKPIGEIWSTDASDDGNYVESEVRNNELGIVEIEERKVDGQEERNRVAAVWWKLPLDLLKYCLFKSSPVWSLSIAAAMMGVVILGRRLYKIKHNTRTLQIKVTMDDKKVSQVMTRAARLNEAFTVVKRGPIIRPSLPAAGITPWPMMALR